MRWSNEFFIKLLEHERQQREARLRNPTPGGSFLKACVQISAIAENAEMACYFGNALSKMLAFVPPNPKLLERIVSILVEL